MTRSSRTSKARLAGKWTILAAVSFIILSISTAHLLTSSCTAGTKGIKLTLLSSSEKLIPLYYQHGDYWCTHLKTPDILVRNDSHSDITVDRIIVTGLAGGREVTRIVIYSDEIEKLTASSSRSLNELLADREDQSNFHRLGRLFGQPAEMVPEYNDNASIPPGGYAAMQLSKASYLFHEGSLKLDRIEIAVESGPKKSGAEKLEIRLHDFTCRGEYIYPVKGSSVSASIPFGHSHRFGNGQEFAIDIMDIRRFDDGSFSTSSVPNPMVIMGSSEASDYYIYGREVIAMADGMVLEVASSFPDDMASNPQDFYAERIPRITPELQGRGLTPPNITAGNFVLIDHGNGEFARYCHLRENIPVKKGDRVTQNQVIGYVGNSGNSMEPHLHLELLDSADYRTANGLPILFSDLQLGAALDSPTLGERNSLVFSEFIFIYAR